MDIPEFIRAKNVVDYYFLCKNDRIKRAKRYRRQRNIMGSYKRGTYENMPYKKPKKFKKSKKSKGKAVHQRLVAVGGAGTRYREKKNNDVAANFAATIGVATWSTPLLLNGIATGDDGTSRDGRKILTKSILIRWMLNTDTDATDFGHSVRMVLFYDKQANNAVPAVTDLFTTDNVLTTNNLNNADRFVILKDKIVGPWSGIYTGPKMGVFSIKTQMETLYGLNTDVIAAINSGSIWFTCAFDGNGLDNGAGTLYTNMRLRFVDV